ncbi:uncharacterized protein DS421_12g388480 [Arachis hypogaea]|nr:uncharacterized protein DS421_12g388480 [Arachis hypogaea]
MRRKESETQKKNDIVKHVLLHPKEKHRLPSPFGKSILSFRTQSQNKNHIHGHLYIPFNAKSLITITDLNEEIPEYPVKAPTEIPTTLPIPEIDPTVPPEITTDPPPPPHPIPLPDAPKPPLSPPGPETPVPEPGVVPPRPPEVVPPRPPGPEIVPPPDITPPRGRGGGAPT